MTGYYVCYDQSVNDADIAIRAGTYELRVASIAFWNNGTGGYVFNVNRHEASSLGGGAALDVVPMRQGAPVASCTARVGTTLTFSGTNKVVGSTYVPPGETSSVYTSGMVVAVLHTYPGSSAQAQQPLPLTIAPGSVLHIAGGFSESTQFTSLGTTLGCNIYFDELRLPGSY